MADSQIMLKQHAEVEVFTQLKIERLVERELDLLNVTCRNTCGDFMAFVLFGRNNIKKLFKNFIVGDTVNVVSEGRIIRKFTKGIDMEV